MYKIDLARELVALGYDHDELARLTRVGSLDHIRRGAYSVPPTSPLTARQAHLRLVEATVRLSGPDAVVGHHSAAAIYGLPLWNDSLDRVHLIRSRPLGGGKIRSQAHLHPTPLDDDEIRTVSGLRVTSPARTIVDLARTLPLRRSVPLGDQALIDLIDEAELMAALARAKGWPGIRLARRVAAFLDPRSESVGESLSRVVLHDLGAPTPSLQYEVFNERDELVGCTDFGWKAQGTLGEFDGKIKYGRLLRPGQSASEVVWAEKQREDALRDLGWQIVRWTWDDLSHPDDLRKRLHRAFARAERTRRARR